MLYAYVKTKTQHFLFFFITWIVQFLSYLNLKFQASSLLYFCADRFVSDRCSREAAHIKIQTNGPPAALFIKQQPGYQFYVIYAFKNAFSITVLIILSLYSVWSQFCSLQGTCIYCISMWKISPSDDLRTSY